ncbi:MAG: ribonuclease HII [Candidatus Nanohaloarchaeota archaeon QJJ-9]|nr:ribonuclease HII [Candidatus Nanohaloarchaeota archaeon QJJ-9]
MSKTILGIDEAGRGPVIGSMFVGGVAIEKEKLEKLEELGLKDSKKLSDNRRKSLGPKIREVANEVFVKEVTASEIDELREIMSLNVIEIKAFAEVIKELQPDKAFIDLPEPDGERFGRKIKKELGERVELEIVAEHGADDTYPIVSAASIVAKNAREEQVDRLHKKYGADFKSGYPHDKPTTDFLKDYLDKHGELPEETRLSWSTAERIIEEQEQKEIDEF